MSISIESAYRITNVEAFGITRGSFGNVKLTWCQNCDLVDVVILENDEDFWDRLRTDEEYQISN